MKAYPPYNPLDKMNLGRSVADAMLATPLLPLGTLEPFTGAGIYLAARKAPPFRAGM